MFFSGSLPHLTHLTLLGPFLVRSETWIKFFKARPELRSFRITQSPRFDLECTKSLAENCTKLEELQLKEIAQLNDAFVEPLCALPSLTLLDLSNPDTGIEESGWLQLLERHGSTLASFDPSRHEGFTDEVLHKGIRQYARVLSELKLEGLPSLTDKGVAKFFENWAKPYVTAEQEENTESGMDVDEGGSSVPFTPNPPLHVLSLARNHHLSSAMLTAVLTHSAPYLVSLNLNGLASLSTESLGQLIDAVEMRRLDVSWCREMDDFVMKDVVANMPKLAEVKLWGCSRVRGTGWAGKVRKPYSRRVSCLHDLMILSEGFEGLWYRTKRSFLVHGLSCIYLASSISNHQDPNTIASYYRGIRGLFYSLQS
jgi:DNA repair protein RAD7